MSEQNSENSFFFADYGCCIPTESYAWILVALFVTTILVLLVCMLATAVIRWMYKRRMRKRLHDLKRKFLMDQMKEQEFEAKLNFMAQKNRSFKNEDGSKEDFGDNKEKLTIFVDPAQKELEKRGTQKKQSSLQKAVGGRPGNMPIYDRDETPIAQSTLATQSKTHLKPKENDRWLYLPKSQQHKPKIAHDDTSLAPTPQYIPPPPRAPPAPRPPAQAPPPPPPHAKSYYDLPPNMIAPPKVKSSPPKTKDLGVDMGGTSPIIPLDPNDVSPEVTKKNDLAPPTIPTSSGFTTTTSGGSSSVTTPSGFTTSSTTPTFTTTPGESTTTPSSTKPSGVSDDSFTTPLRPVFEPPKASTTSPSDDVKQNVQYGQDDIVSPLGSQGPESKDSKKLAPERKEGAGGKGEWKYYYAEENGDKKKKKMVLSTTTTTTKSSDSHRRTSNSWLFDSTGSNRFDSSGPVVLTSGGSSGKTNSTVSSSILKTDSSYYKTASMEQFPHGAFTFQSN